ncbi:LamG-like jellyroll fold domain-containing protein [Salinispora arenicola]|uniref:LamG-like jellyroll fold domain-containing protein n=1 Tax=Salinispora arenicola TaxID=168697 RepID=UPI0027E2A26E|nr:LamG-like jellyroll fold domain-containing protein [Salinispora arenicola]
MGAVVPAASAVRWRRLAAAAVVAVLGVAGVVALSPPLPAAAVADPLPCAAEAADVSQAAEMAERCGSPVEALSERTEKNRLTVEPGGTARFVGAMEPMRVRSGDGSWRDVDTSLRAGGPEGSVVPVATLADVRFSGGGSEPMVTWLEGASTFTLSWPAGPLPQPRVEGDTAVYPSVLPDVDLHVTSTADGFQWVLEVKTASAAANPVLRDLRYGIGGDVRVESTPEGGLRVVDATGGLFAASPAAVMWDSTRMPPPVGARSLARTSSVDGGVDGAGAGQASSVAAPGEAAKTAPVELAVVEDELSVVPDVQLLTDPSVTYPIFIDPALSKQRSKWAYETSNGENNDASAMRVGRQPPSDGSGEMYRSFFEFDVSAIRRTNIVSAEVTMTLDHSYSCDPTSVYLYRPGGNITVASGGRMPWKSRPLGSSAQAYLGSWAGSANESGGCGKPDQGDANAVFDHAYLKDDLQYAASSGFTIYTLGLCNCSPTNNEYETWYGYWKKFYTSGIYLNVTYDLAPYKPVPQAFSTTTDCYQQCVSPAWVRTTTPTLKVSVQDPFGGELRTIFEVRTAPSDSATVAAWNYSPWAPVHTYTPPVTSPGTSPAGTAVWKVPAGKLTSGTYYWRARTGDEVYMWSGWSPWQTLSVDTSPPGVSSVASSEFPGKQWGAEVGTAGTFTLASASDAAEFSWQVDAGPVTTVAATGGDPATATTGWYTPATDMVHTLYAKAKDVAGNVGPTVEHQFWVTPAVNRCWNWRLDETSGATAKDWGNQDPEDWACPPIGPSVTPMPGAVSSGVTWMADTERGQVAGFDGTGQIATSSAVLDTTKAFTVTAWVKLTDLVSGSVQTIVSQAGEDVSDLSLEYRQDANGGAGGFCFTMAAGDGELTTACADPVSWPVTEDQWVHLAGVYDPTLDVVRVHVMGDPTFCAGDFAEAPFTLPRPASGPFLIGRGTQGASDSPAYQLTGQMSDVYVFQRVLSNNEICQMSFS